MEPQKLDFYCDEKIQVTGCFEIVMFIPGRLEKIHSHIKKAYDTFISRFGTELDFYRLNDQKKYKKIRNSQDLEILPYLLKDPDNWKSYYFGITLHKGASGLEKVPPSFQFFYDSYTDDEADVKSIIRMALPLEYGNAKTNESIELLKEAYSECPIEWGYAGYSMIWSFGNYYDNVIKKWCLPLWLRHWGLTIPDHIFVLSNYICCSGPFMVSWLNVFGNSYIKKMGGIDLIRQSTDSSKVTLSLLGDDKITLTAGEKPGFGDVTKGDYLPLYRAVGKIMEPIRAANEQIEEIYSISYSSEDTEEQEFEWNMRFFKDFDVKN